MKITTVIARFLLGLIFLVFGLRGYLHFLPSQRLTGMAGQFVGALFVSHYLMRGLAHRAENASKAKSDEVQEWGAAVSSTNRTLQELT